MSTDLSSRRPFRLPARMASGLEGKAHTGFEPVLGHATGSAAARHISTNRAWRQGLRAASLAKARQSPDRNTTPDSGGFVQKPVQLGCARGARHDVLGRGRAAFAKIARRRFDRGRDGGRLVPGRRPAWS